MPIQCEKMLQGTSSNAQPERLRQLPKNLSQAETAYIYLRFYTPRRKQGQNDRAVMTRVPVVGTADCQ